MGGCCGIEAQAQQDRRVRLDRWLWAVRLFKTRGLAATACRLGQVRVDGEAVKAARGVRAGDEFDVDHGDLCRRVRVLATLEKRVGAKRVADSMEDLTRPEIWEAARQAAAERSAGRVVAEAGEGRPTKRRRRQMDAFLDKADRASRK